MNSAQGDPKVCHRFVILRVQWAPWWYSMTTNMKTVIVLILHAEHTHTHTHTHVRYFHAHRGNYCLFMSKSHLIKLPCCLQSSRDPKRIRRQIDEIVSPIDETIAKSLKLPRQCSKSRASSSWRVESGFESSFRGSPRVAHAGGVGLGSLVAPPFILRQ